VGHGCRERRRHQIGLESMVLRMAITSDAAATAVLETMEVLGETWVDGWIRREANCIAMVSGVEVPTLNGVVVASEQFDAPTVSRLLDEVAASGLPYCLQVRPACASSASELSAARSLGLEEDGIPLMVLEDPLHLAGAQSIDSLVIRELEPADADIHAQVAAAGFDAPVELFQQLATPSMLSTAGVRCYVGEVDGEPVTTGFGFTVGSHVSIFSVATPPDHRRHGFGAAVTARAAADGLAAGANWAWLQASPDGFPVYERLGFRSIESWSCWLSRPDSAS